MFYHNWCCLYIYALVYYTSTHLDRKSNKNNTNIQSDMLIVDQVAITFDHTTVAIASPWPKPMCRRDDCREACAGPIRLVDVIWLNGQIDRTWNIPPSVSIRRVRSIWPKTRLMEVNLQMQIALSVRSFKVNFMSGCEENGRGAEMGQSIGGGCWHHLRVFNVSLI